MQMKWGVAALLLCVLSTVGGVPFVSLDCKYTMAPYTTANVTFQSVNEVFTLSVYEGTAFFIDCYNFAVATPQCDGTLGSLANLQVESWVLTVDASTGRELSRHPLSGSLLGPSVLTTAYYYSQARRIYLQLRLPTQPRGSRCATNVTVLYSFSAYSSVRSPPRFNQSAGAPFLAAHPQPHDAIMASVPTSLRFRVPEEVQLVAATTAASTLYAIGTMPILRGGDCSRAVPQGSLAFVTGPNAAGVLETQLQWNVTLTVSGFSMLCLKQGLARNSSGFLYLGVLNVYRGNPAFLDVATLPPTAPIRLNVPYEVTFVGANLNPRSDQAKLASLTQFSCAAARPAGGVPLGTTLAPQGAASAVHKVYWNITVTIPGTFFVCYFRSGSWVSVPWYMPSPVNSRLLIDNIRNAIGGASSDVPTMWRSRTRSRSLPPSNETLAPTPSPPITLAPPVTLEPTEAPTTAPTPPPANCMALPEECPELQGDWNTLRLVLTLGYRQQAFPLDSWRRNLSQLLCIGEDSIGVYEMRDDADSATTSSLVMGITCKPSELACSNTAPEVLSLLRCFSGTEEIVNATEGEDLNTTYTAFRAQLRGDPLRILNARSSSSAITTANSTNHAAPSESHPLLTPTEAAIVSSSVIAGIGAGVGAVFLFILYKKRTFVRRQLGRLKAGEVFRTTIPHRAAHSLNDADMAFLTTQSVSGGTDTIRSTLDYPLLSLNTYDAAQDCDDDEPHKQRSTSPTSRRQSSGDTSGNPIRGAYASPNAGAVRRSGATAQSSTAAPPQHFDSDDLV